MAHKTQNFEHKFRLLYLCINGYRSFLFSLVIFVFIYATTALYTVQAASTYYVSTSGLDSNTGTISDPWRTIQHAADTLSNGDTVIVAAGTYSELVSVTTSGITFQTSGTVNTTGFNIVANTVTVTGFSISNSAVNEDNGIYAEGSNITISSNIINDVPSLGIKINATNSTVIGNTITQPRVACVWVTGQNNTVENNDCSDVIQPSPHASGGDADCFRFFNSGHTFRGNYCHDMSYDGVLRYDAHIDCFQTWNWVSVGGVGHDVTLEGNFCKFPDEGKGGDFEEGAYNLTIKNNIVYGSGGLIVNGNNISYLNNTFVGPVGPTDDGPHISDSTNIYFYNNIFSTLNYAIEDIGTNTIYSDHNLYYQVSHSRPDDTGDVKNQNPGFIDATTNNYHIGSTSPAINVGATLASVTDDYDGVARPQGSGYDMGAYEYISNVIPSVSLGSVSPDPGTDTTPTITGTATDSDGTISLVSYQVDSTSGSWTSCTADDGTFDEASEAFSCTSGILSSASHTIYVRAQDNSSDYSTNSSDTFVVDAVVPTTPGTPSTTSPTTDTTPTWSWTASTDSGSGLATPAYSVQWCENSSYTGCGSNVDTSATNSYTHGTALTVATWYFRVKATDAVGNVSSWSSDGVVEIQSGVSNVIPSVSLGSVSPDPGTDTTPTITGTATDSDGTISLVSYQVDSTSGSWTSCTADDGTFDEASEAFSCTSGILSSASHTIYVRAQDNSSDYSTNSSDTFVVESTGDSGGNDDDDGDSSEKHKNALEGNVELKKINGITLYTSVIYKSKPWLDFYSDRLRPEFSGVGDHNVKVRVSYWPNITICETKVNDGVWKCSPTFDMKQGRYRVDIQYGSKLLPPFNLSVGTIIPTFFKSAAPTAPNRIEVPAAPISVVPTIASPPSPPSIVVKTPKYSNSVFGKIMNNIYSEGASQVKGIYDIKLDQRKSFWNVILTKDALVTILTMSLGVSLLVSALLTQKRDVIN